MEETKTIASNELLMEQLSNRDWSDFWLRLMGRCAWLLRKRYSVKWPNDQLKDFSHKAISEIIDKIFIEKTRKWNIDRYPDFESFIVGAIDSHINNTLNKESVDVEIENMEQIFHDNETSPVDVIISKELREEIFEDLQNAGANDDELMIFECLADGIDKPESIRTELGLTEENFHNIWRRFKRKREIIQKKLAGYGY